MCVLVCMCHFSAMVCDAQQSEHEQHWLASVAKQRTAGNKTTVISAKTLMENLPQTHAQGCVCRCVCVSVCLCVCIWIPECRLQVSKLRTTGELSSQQQWPWQISSTSASAAISWRTTDLPSPLRSQLPSDISKRIDENNFHLSFHCPSC